MDRDDLLQLLDGLPVAVFVMGADGRPAYANRLAVEFLGEGVVPGAAPGSEIAEQYVADTDEPYPRERMPIMRALLGEQASVDDMELRLPGGRVIPLEVWGTPIKGDDGSVPYAAAAFVDISERARADRAEVEAVRLRELDTMKNAFLTAISHELRTPLTVVLGFAKTLNRRGLELPVDKLTDMARRLESNALKLERLIVDLLDVDRLARGTLDIRPRDLDLAELVRRVVETLGVESRIELDLEHVMVKADVSLVERIVDNLISNALRHGATSKPVAVGVHADDGGALLVVDDRGPGVPDELKLSIFAEFEQGSSHPTHAPGLGVGLVLVSRFAALHGGRAWVEDRPGGGASFRVHLPAR